MDKFICVLGTKNIDIIIEFV